MAAKSFILTGTGSALNIQSGTRLIVIEAAVFTVLTGVTDFATHSFPALFEFNQPITNVTLASGKVLVEQS